MALKEKVLPVPVVRVRCGLYRTADGLFTLRVERGHTLDKAFDRWFVDSREAGGTITPAGFRRMYLALRWLATVYRRKPAWLFPNLFD